MITMNEEKLTGKDWEEDEGDSVLIKYYDDPRDEYLEAKSIVDYLREYIASLPAAGEGSESDENARASAVSAMETLATSLADINDARDADFHLIFNHKSNVDDGIKHQEGSGCSNDKASSSKSGDNNSDEADIPTFPYMNSDDDEDEDSDDFTPVIRLKSSESLRAIHEDDIIVIDDEDEDDSFKGPEGPMKCHRCPVKVQIFKDRQVFLLHVKRHFGMAHYVCPTCSKPFTKLSFCLAHEVRVHRAVFNVGHPIVIEAQKHAYFLRSTRAEKLNDAASTDTIKSENKDPENGESTADVNNEDGEFSDEDEPKFYPDEVVPSTTLYPYRGPVVNSIYESYEIHLKYGRSKKTNTNTVSRVIVARRHQLKKQGFIQHDTEGQIYKIQEGPLKKGIPSLLERGKLYSLADRMKFKNTEPPSKKRKKQQVTRKRKKTTTVRNQRHVITNRAFVSSIITRVCLLCEYIWTTEVDLRMHRDQTHPRKTVLQLMTVPTKDQTKQNNYPKIAVESRTDEQIRNCFVLLKRL